MDQEQRQPGSLLTSADIDTLGEILNISMGSAATAISTLLDRQVNISTPKVELRGFSALDYAELDPAMMVKINYVQGITGANLMIFRQRDMQVILGLLMGNDEEPIDDFVFDELSISAACEVMNQMMGASATALSDFLGSSINISTPEAIMLDSPDAYHQAIEVNDGEEIVSVSFQLLIDGVMDSSFASILPMELAINIIEKVLGEQMRAMEEIEPQTASASPAASVPPVASAPPVVVPPGAAQTPAPPYIPEQAAPAPAEQPAYVPPPVAGYTPPPAYTPAPPYPPHLSVYGQPYDPSAYPPGYPPPYYYPPTPPTTPPPQVPSTQTQAPSEAVSVQTPQFPTFPAGATSQSPATNSNMDLLMRVSLDVSVEIGKAKRKIRDILDFGQGTVIELNKQAGAPVDIVVNGCLLARGDVVVIDDNFGVRITEIVGAKELMESLKEETGL
jgi:flagellar motor switch protein FliN/FliY